MGKIPGAKHHGAKDPMEQKARREAKFIHKINKKPASSLECDQQPFSRKGKAFLKLIEAGKQQEIPREKKLESGLLSSAKYMTKHIEQPGMTEPLRPVPIFNQRKGETEKMFFKRMDITTGTMQKQRKYEEQYNVKFETNKDGQSTMIKNKEELLTEKEFQKKKRKLAKKGITLKTPEEKRALEREKEKARKNKKKCGKPSKSGKIEHDMMDFSDLQDRQEFGEEVHAPPNLNYKPRKPVNKKKADKINELLLNKKLKKSAGGVGKNGDNTDKAKNDGKVKKSKKKDDMSLSQKEKLEEERERVIQAYRDIKSKQYDAANNHREN